MPTVPKSPFGQVQTRALPGPRLNPSVPEGAFNGAAKIGKAIQDLYAQEQEKADQVAVLDADRQLADFENRALYDPKSGAFSKKGKDAFGVPEQVMSEFDKASGEIYKTLGNDNQRLAYRRYMESRRRDIDRSVQRHVSEEINRHDDETTETFVANEFEAAVFNFRDPERVAHSIDRIEKTYADYAKRRGKSPEWLKQKTEATVSKAHSAIATRMLANGDDLLASAYVKANKDEIAGTDLTALEKSLEEGSLRGESQRQADSILQKHAAADDRDAALKDARAIKDPKIRDAVETRINSFFTGRHFAETERRNKLFINATNLVDKTGDETKIEPHVWTQLSLEQRNALKLYAKNKREGTEPTLDHPTWVKFTYQTEEQLAKMSEAEFMEKYYPKLDKPHRDRGLEMLRMARAATKKDGEKDPKFATTVTFNNMVRNTLEKAAVIEPGQAPAKWDEETARRHTAFESEAWKRIEQFERTELGGKRPATRLEMQSIMDQTLMDKVFVDEWGRDPEVPAIFIKEDQRGKTYVPLARVPKDIKIEAVNLAKSLGNIPQNMAQAEAEKILARRIERAYAVRLTKGTRQEIIDIIRGHN